MRTTFFKWIPVVDPDCCTGCGRCVEVCNVNSLQLVNKTAVLMRPDICGSDDHCVAPCPEGAIRMKWVELDADRAHGKWSRGYHYWPSRIRGRRAYF